MDEMKTARGMGWFSIGLGLVEAVAGRSVGRALGMEDQSLVFRAFGAREIATGVAILTMDQPKAGMWARVAGDVLDLAALGSGMTPDNPKKANLAAAISVVAGITWLDYWCARRLSSARPHSSLSRHREYVADGPSSRLSSGDFPVKAL